MNWYYSEGNQQRGPVSEQEFQQLASTGTIQPATLVWREGMPDWQPYSTVFSAAGAPSAGLPPLIGGGIICVECGKSFPADEVIQYNGQNVCAACKPVFIQRIKEGASPNPMAGQAGLTAEELLNRDYEVRSGESFSKAWKMTTSKFGTMVGAGAVVFLLSFICGIIPFVGFLFQLALQGALMGGLWLTMLKQSRTGDAEVGDVFGGFGKRYVQLLLANVVQTLLIWACMLPVGLAAGIAIPGLAKSGSAVGMGVFGFLIILVGLGVLMFLSVCWAFTLPLVADKGLAFWPAMELSRKMVMKHWGSVCGACITAGLFAMLGALACGIGFFVTGVVAIAMLTFIYEDIFGQLIRIER
jgi:hypothetical protein